MSKDFRYAILMAVGSLTAFAAAAQDAMADRMLLYQRSVGGWPKHINEIKVDYAKELSPAETAALLRDRPKNDATIDNSATTREISYLEKAYAKTGNVSYKTAAEKGVRYLLQMQQASGGWPQFYPDSSAYRAQITYNDNAMINAMNVLWDVACNTEATGLDPALKAPAAEAVRKGIGCILNTQVRVNGKLTAWCAQHDRKTLQPVKARAFELVSLSGSESVGIVKFLMRIEKPSNDIKAAIEAAVDWFRTVRIDGYKYEDIEDPAQPKGKDRVLVPAPGEVLWARFYDIETNRPFFCGRDGVKRWNLAEIENERRTGYAWYGNWAKGLLEKEYPQWKKKNNP